MKMEDLLGELKEHIHKEINGLREELMRVNIPKVLTQDDLVKYYSLSRSVQSKYRSTKAIRRLPHSKNGGIIRYDRDEVEKWLLNK